MAMICKILFPGDAQVRNDNGRGDSGDCDEAGVLGAGVSVDVVSVDVVSGDGVSGAGVLRTVVLRAWAVVLHAAHDVHHGACHPAAVHDRELLVLFRLPKMQKYRLKPVWKAVFVFSLAFPFLLLFPDTIKPD